MGNLPIEAKGIPNIGLSNSQYRLQDVPVVGIAPIFALASIVCTYNHITVYATQCKYLRINFVPLCRPLGNEVQFTIVGANNEHFS